MVINEQLDSHIKLIILHSDAGGVELNNMNRKALIPIISHTEKAFAEPH